jgi:hypothetical protein
VDAARETARERRFLLAQASATGTSRAGCPECDHVAVRAADELPVLSVYARDDLAVTLELRGDHWAGWLETRFSSVWQKEDD